MRGQNGADRDKSVELVYGGAAAADQPTESEVGDIVARAWAALEGIESLLPWVCDNRPPSTGYTVMARYIDDRGRASWRDLASDNEGSWWSEGNAKFVAQSPGLVAKLVAEVVRLRGVCDERDRLAATVERVWGLAVKMKGEHGQSWNTISGQRILAALDGAWDYGSGDPS